MARIFPTMPFPSLFIFALTFSSLHQSGSGGRPLLCQVPSAWMVDSNGIATLNNGSFNPISGSAGNVTVIFLLKASDSTDHVQATRMKDMDNLLRSTGLTDIKFFVVNSPEAISSEERSQLVTRVSGSEIQVYQDTESVSIWEKLKGGRGDLFIYDRCGRLTYYIPSPLSMLSARAPIAQATILSAYFDNPCGSCPTTTEPTPASFNISDRISATESSLNGTENVTEDFEVSTDPVEDPVTNSSDIQLQFITNVVDLNGTSIQSQGENGDQRNGHVMLQPWKIFEFFLNGSMNGSSSENSTEMSEAVTTEIPSLNTTIANEKSIAESNTTSTVTTSVLNCEASQCVEFSTDSILRARLCCLREEVGSDGETTIGCRTYNRITCSQMLPLIKCCLKDFSQLLANYFRSQRNGRKPTSPGYVG